MYLGVKINGGLPCIRSWEQVFEWWEMKIIEHLLIRFLNFGCYNSAKIKNPEPYLF